MTSPSIPSAPFLSASRSWLPLAVIAVCLFFIGLGRLPLLEPDEGRNAEVAREMLVSHDWITPHYDTLPYLDKPVILFWAVAGSFRCFGLSEWAARFPSALAGALTVLMVWLAGAKLDGGKTGLRAGVLLATSLLFFALARMVIFDMLLTFWITLARSPVFPPSSLAPASQTISTVRAPARAEGNRAAHSERPKHRNEPATAQKRITGLSR